LEGTSPLRNAVAQKSPTGLASSGEFVPMTPHTRRESLMTSMVGGTEKLAAVRGGIEVLYSQPLRAASATTAPEESAVIWMGTSDPIVAVIPGISRFWDAQVRRGAGGGVNLFSGAQPTRMIRLTDLGAGLLGERCTGVAVLPRSSNQHNSSPSSNGPNAGEATSSAEGLPIDVLVQGETRLVVVHDSEDAAVVANRPFAPRKQYHSIERFGSAIIAYPRPDKPGSVAFNLSVARGPNPGVSHKRLPVAGLFGTQSTDVIPSTETDLDTASSTRDTGLAFTQTLDMAADATDDEQEAEDRDVEEEMLDIMEIDRELEEMESERESGRKHVFFEDV